MCAVPPPPPSPALFAETQVGGSSDVKEESVESQSRSLDVDERSAHGSVLSSEGEEEPGLQDVWRRASDSRFGLGGGVYFSFFTLTGRPRMFHAMTVRLPLLLGCSTSSSEEGAEAEEEEDRAGPRTPAQQRLLERTLSRQVPTPAPAPEEFGSGSSAESDVDQQEVKAALFNVDVDVGGGQLRRLVVRRGDSPHALAQVRGDCFNLVVPMHTLTLPPPPCVDGRNDDQTFVSRHGLSDRVLPKLEALLAARIVDYQRRL